VPPSPLLSSSSSAPPHPHPHCTHTYVQEFPAPNLLVGKDNTAHTVRVCPRTWTGGSGSRGGGNRILAAPLPSNLPSPQLPGPVATIQLQTQDKEYLWVYFWGTCGAPAGQGFDPLPRHPSPLCSHGSGDQGSCVRICLTGEEEGRLLCAVISFLFKDIILLKCLLPIERKWVLQTMSPREREIIAVKPHYQAPRPKTTYGEQIPNARSHCRPRCNNQPQKSSRKIRKSKIFALS
jgi:hypothetical protein